MAQQAQVPKFGNWETAESVPYTQYFDQARRKKGGGDGNETSEAYAKDVPSLTNAAPLTTGSNNETTKPRDAKPTRTEGGNLHRTDTPPVRNDVVRKSPTNPRHQQHVDQANYGDNQKRSNRNNGGYQGKPTERAANNPPSAKRVVSEGTPGRIRTNPGDRVYGTPPHDITVPPFAGWDENDPASGEKYTGIFNVIAHNRRTPGTPYEPPQPSDQQQKSTKPKGCGCLSWILK